MLPGERPNSAFARYYSLPENISLRKAVAIAKNAPVPALVSPEPVRLVDNVSDVDQSAAYQKLEKMADELRTRLPHESPQQCFAKVFQDPANATLANAAHRRPVPTTSYEYPR